MPYFGQAMYELLFRTFEEKFSPTEEERKIIKSCFISKKLRKRQFLLQEGDISNRLAFVEKGALYSYSTDAKGVPHVLQFAFEGWWIADLYSFFTHKPSKLTIEVLEDSELLLLDREQHEFLLRTIPGFETFIRILYQNAYVALLARVEGTLGLSAEEKYARLLDQYSFISNRVPQNLIASYLGITPETLSRVRKQKTP